MKATDAAGLTATSPAAFARVVCGVRAARSDGEAVRQAAILSAPGASLQLVCVRFATGTGRYAQATIAAARARRALRRARQTAAELGVDATARMVPDSDTWHGLSVAAAGSDLLVLGCCPGSRTAGIVLGRTTTQAVHRSEIPVLVARVSPDARFPERLMLATDGSEDSRRAAELAARICRSHGSTATLVTVGADDERRHRIAEQSADLFRASGVEPAIITRDGTPRDVIPHLVQQEMPSLLVVGSGGKLGVRAIGSVSEHVAHHTPCSVLTARAPGA